MHRKHWSRGSRVNTAPPSRRVRFSASPTDIERETVRDRPRMQRATRLTLLVLTIALIVALAGLGIAVFAVFAAAVHVAGDLMAGISDD